MPSAKMAVVPRLQRYSYRFAEQVLNSRLALKEQLESILTSPITNPNDLSRPALNKLLDERFQREGWLSQPTVFEDAGDPGAKMDFLKDRVGVEVGLGHASFLGMDVLKFQVSSYSALDRIDLGVYVVTTASFQKTVMKTFNQKWEGSLTFEKVCRYLPHFKSAIQVPIQVIGLDL